MEWQQSEASLTQTYLTDKNTDIFLLLFVLDFPLLQFLQVPLFFVGLCLWLWLPSVVFFCFSFFFLSTPPSTYKVSGLLPQLNDCIDGLLTSIETDKAVPTCTFNWTWPMIAQAPIVKNGYFDIRPQKWLIDLKILLAALLRLLRDLDCVGWKGLPQGNRLLPPPTLRLPSLSQQQLGFQGCLTNKHVCAFTSWHFLI